MNRIAELVKQKQAQGQKLSSNQDFQILDDLLIRAMAPLESETEAYFEWLAETATFTITSRRRQNDKLVAACVDGLCGGKDSHVAVMTAGIDRGHIFSLLRKVSDIGITLEKSQIEHIRRHGNRVNNEILADITNSKNRLGFKPTVVAANRTSRYWHKLALKHKERIIDHYLRLLLKISSRISHASGERVEMDSAWQDAYLAASVALDRFRSDQGVFASYLNICLKGSSRVSASHALGLAAPGARVLSADALQADSIEYALDISDPAADMMHDKSTINRIDAISRDQDVRAALMLSDVVPPIITKMMQQSRGVKH